MVISPLPPLPSAIPSSDHLVSLSLSSCSELPPTLALDSHSAGGPLTHSDCLLIQARVRLKASDLLHQYISNILSSLQVPKSLYIRKLYIHTARETLVGGVVANSSPSEWFKPATAKIIPSSILFHQHLSLSTPSSHSVIPPTSTAPTARQTATSPTVDSGIHERIVRCQRCLCLE